MGECTNQTGQLDWLWGMYGGRFVKSNPDEAKGSDLLTKDGIMLIAEKLTGSAVIDIEKLPSKEENIYDIVATLKSGEKKVLFKLRKEEYLKNVTIRKTSQKDIESGLVSESNVPAISFIMNTGREILLPMREFKYTGVKTNSIETFINEDNGIEAVLLLAQNLDPSVSVEITRNGLMVKNVVSCNQGQARLVKKEDGMAVENNWDDNVPIKMRTMTLAEYRNLEIASPEDIEGCGCDCDCGCGCHVKDPAMKVEKGCIYFIYDKDIVILNGVIYGFNVLDSDTIHVEKLESGGYSINVKVSAKNENLISVEKDGIFAGFNWSGSKHKQSFRIQYDTEASYEQLDDNTKDRTLFICADTKRVFVSRNDVSMVDVIGKVNDANETTLYGYINVKVRDLSDRIESANNRIDSAMQKAENALSKSEALEVEMDEVQETVSNIGVEQLGNLSSYNDADLAFKNKDIVLKKTNVIIPFTITSSYGVESGFVFNIREADKIHQAMYWKDSLKPVLYRTLTINPDGELEGGGFYALDDKTNMVIATIPLNKFKGLTAESTNDEIKEVLKDSFNGRYVTPADLDNVFRYGYLLIDSLNRSVISVTWQGSWYDLTTISKINPVSGYYIRTVSIRVTDGAYSISKPYEETGVLTGENLLLDDSIVEIVSNVEELQKKVETLVPYESAGGPENPDQKSIILKNDDSLSGKTSDDTVVSIAKVEKNNTLTLGNNKCTTDLKGSGQRPKFNSNSELALVSDVEAVSGKLDESNKKVETMTSSITTIQETLATIQDTISRNGEIVTGLVERLDAIDKSIADITKRIEALEAAKK